LIDADDSVQTAFLPSGKRLMSSPTGQPGSVSRSGIFFRSQSLTKSRTVQRSSSLQEGVASLRDGANAPAETVLAAKVKQMQVKITNRRYKKQGT